MQVLDEGLQFGASVTLTRLMNMLALLVKERPEEQTRTFKAMFEQLRWAFSSCLLLLASHCLPLAPSHVRIAAMGVLAPIKSLRFGSSRLWEIAKEECTPLCAIIASSLTALLLW